MSDIIQLLPDSVANQIAAGEVIQRPASVVKELVENSIDAGATAINVVCVDSGRTSIQVIDNGKGMSETDARLSFERHATSKIRVTGDLFNLHTMGFRGEALASIAAVAQIELKTRQATDEVGTQLAIAGSRFQSQQPCSCPVGCNFLVENLFYNVPVRRKFLKSNTTELTNIITTFERMVLVNPDIAFTLYNNQSEIYNLKAAGLRQRIVDVFGKKINQQLLPVDVQTSVCRISGYVGKPESARRKGARQFFFVNNRYMKHPYFHKAVMTAFDRLVPEGEQIPYFIYFTVAPEDIDVNIHPTKTEIKFENEQAIWQILTAAVRDAVGMFSDVTAIEFDTEGQPELPAMGEGGEVVLPTLQYNPSYNPFNETAPQRPRSAPADWQQLYSGMERGVMPSGQTLFASPEGDGSTVMQSRRFADMPEIPDLHASSVSHDDADVQPAANISPQNPMHDMPDGDDAAMSCRSAAAEAALHIEEKSPVHYQYKGRYIMTAVKSGLMIVDQRRAHIRILYERYLAQARERKAHAQKVLFPETVHLDKAEEMYMERLKDEMRHMGFELSQLENGDYSICSVPAGLDGLNYVELVRDIVVSAKEQTVSSVDTMQHTLALSLARNAAVTYGQVLGNAEMENIVNDLFACSNPGYTPDGKKTLTLLRQTDMDNMLG